MKTKLAAAAVLLSAVASADAPKPPSTEDAIVARLEDAKWAPAKAPGIPEGIVGAPIAVDPKTKGPLGYARFPSGLQLPAHWHSYAEYSTLLSGKATLTVDGKPHELSAGSYFSIPAKVKHDLKCGADADCIVLTRRAGPVDYHWVEGGK
jgi:quercetin dioxygenase-like cupin family protein